MDFVERVRIIEQDHEPDGWPAIQTHELRAAADEIQRLREELARHEWHPIETAPKGSGSVGVFDRSLPDYEEAPTTLLLCDGEVKIGCYEWCYDPVVGQAVDMAEGPWICDEGYAVHPTHWMLLPAPPKEDA